MGNKKKKEKEEDEEIEENKETKGCLRKGMDKGVCGFECFSKEVEEIILKG